MISISTTWSIVMEVIGEVVLDLLGLELQYQKKSWEPKLGALQEQ